MALTTGSIKWLWRDNSNDLNLSRKSRELGFRIWSSTGGPSIGDLPIKSFGINTTFYYYEDGKQVNTLYTRYVEARNEIGYNISNSSGIYTLANKPTSSRVLNVSSVTVRLRWFDNFNPSPATRYGIIRSTGPDFFRSTETWKLSFANNLTTTTYLNTGLQPNTSYWYKICAFNGNGVRTAYDIVIATKTNDSAPIPPTDFHCIALSTGSIRWLWTDIAANEQAYWVDDNGHTRKSPALQVNASSWTETGLSLNAAYTRCAEVSNTRGSNYSNQITSYTLANPTTHSYSISVTSYSVSLAWLKNSNPSYTKWGIIRSTGPNHFISTTTVRDFSNNLTALSYTNTGLLPSTSYWFKIRAFNGNGIPTIYDLEIATRTNPAPLAAPQNFHGIAISTVSIYWVWIDTSTNENGFRVYEPTVTLRANLPPNTTGWTDMGLSINSRYTSYAESYNITSTSKSIVDSKYTLANPPVGSHITNVTPLKISLSWDVNNNPSYTCFGIFRSTNNFSVSYTTVLSFDDDYILNSFTDSGLVPDTSYYYKVCGYNGDGIPTPFDFTISTRTHPGNPKMPANFKGVAVSTTSISWSWTKSLYADGYYIKNATGGIKGTLSANTTFCLEIGLSLNTSYYRYAVAYNVTGSSASNADTKFTLANPPSILYTAVSTSTYHKAKIVYNQNCATRLKVQISTSSLFDVNVETKTWTDNISLSPFWINHLRLNSTYYFGLWGYNGDGILSKTRLVIFGNTQDLPGSLTKIMPSLGGKQTWYALINDTSVLLEADVPAFTLTVPVYILITPNALENPQLVNAAALNFANTKIKSEANRHIFEPSVTEFNMYDFYGSTAGSWSKNVTITLSYPDANNDGIADDKTTRYRVNNFFMVYMNPITQEWEDISGGLLDTANKRLRADVSHFSMYSIAASGPLGGFYSRIYPNPFKPNSSLGHTVITFANLQIGSTIRVYGISGVLVYKLENILTSDITWDGTNSSGKKLASGVYIYVVTDQTGATIKGNFAIIR